ncbi:inosine/xanthosine triphosphatase, partial [Vibrio parahaemolyticus]|nr:inosine/xanthosine triphosphatase [Vibrio parahaemolyticus]
MATQKVVIASLNPAKINAVQSAFRNAFPHQ